MLTLHSALKETLLPGLVATAFSYTHSGISKYFADQLVSFPVGFIVVVATLLFMLG